MVLQKHVRSRSQCVTREWTNWKKKKCAYSAEVVTEASRILNASHLCARRCTLMCACTAIKKKKASVNIKRSAVGKLEHKRIQVNWHGRPCLLEAFTHRQRQEEKLEQLERHALPEECFGSTSSQTRLHALALSLSGAPSGAPLSLWPSQKKAVQRPAWLAILAPVAQQC